MPKYHAKCSASKADRWMHCPGSIALEDRCPAEKPSEYASEGTLAHALAELRIRAGLTDDKLDPETYVNEYARIRNDPMYSAEMDECTKGYYDMIYEAAMAAGPDAEVLVEQRFRLDKWIPEGFGTADELAQRAALRNTPAVEKQRIYAVPRYLLCEGVAPDELIKFFCEKLSDKKGN